MRIQAIIFYVIIFFPAPKLFYTLETFFFKHSKVTETYTASLSITDISTLSKELKPVLTWKYFIRTTRPLFQHDRAVSLQLTFHVTRTMTQA